MPGLEGAHPPARPATRNPTPTSIERKRWVAWSTLPTPRRPVMC